MLKRSLPWLLKGGLSAALIWFLLYKLDMAAAVRQAALIPPAMLVLVLAMILLQILMGAVRWRAVMGAIGPTLSSGKTIAVYFIGVFFNLALPSSVGGDAVRMWKARQAGLSLTGAVHSVVLERIVTVFSLLLLVVATQPLLLNRLEHVPGAWVFPLLTLGGLAGIILLMVLDRVPTRYYRWKLVRAAAEFAGDTRRLFLNPRHATLTLSIALLAHINLSLAHYVLAVGLHIPVSIIDCMVLVPPVTLITTLPISVGGWGVREGAMVVAFGFVGVPAESALVLSVLFGIINVVACLPGGIVWLMSPDRHAAARELKS
ncbi:MAG: flippase-like domain-containing protein [Rhodospirillales bacterium]|nr:flippase-like domain-containing protein [Rhodospirillales bacterium]